MKIAIVGSGISGLIAAYLLGKKYSVTIYEEQSWIGGHAHTVTVNHLGHQYALDTGFLVCNTTNYPNFIKLMAELKVNLIDSCMSLSIANTQSGMEYNLSSMRELLAQKRNLINPKFYGMLYNILRFNRAAKQIAKDNLDIGISVGEMLEKLNINAYCYNNFILPMIAAIWSNGIKDAKEIPAYFICKFFDNHGLLDVPNPIKWLSVANGSTSYINALCNTLEKPVLTNTKVDQIVRKNDKVLIYANSQITEFDKVIVATHSDQALAMLDQPTAAEYDILSKFDYINNDVILHTDINVLPKNPKLWAAWNYRCNDKSYVEAFVTYNLNILQKISSDATFCISLNQRDAIDPQTIIHEFTYAHPKYTKDSLVSQRRHAQISGIDNTYYCGAYWGQGFHEDGLNSGLAVVNQIDKDILCKTAYTVAT